MRRDGVLVAAALHVLIEARTGLGALERVWPAAKTAGTAKLCAQLLGALALPQNMLDSVIASSALASSLSSVQLSAAFPDIS